MWSPIIKSGFQKVVEMLGKQHKEVIELLDVKNLFEEVGNLT
jgi:hypothetical protein